LVVDGVSKYGYNPITLVEGNPRSTIAKLSLAGGLEQSSRIGRMLLREGRR
jgi:hypothetical protein